MTKSVAESLSLEEKVGQLFFIGIPADTLTDETVHLIEKVKPGGVCLFARNIKSPEQTRDLIDAVRRRLSIEPFISIDEEGGLVDRLRRILTPMPAASRIRSETAARRQAELISEALLMLGFNMNFAPVVDVIDTHRTQFNNGLHSRAFGTSSADVAGLAGAFLESMQAGGIVGCIKHFPGLGASRVDSHEQLPLVEVDPAEFNSVDLAPYRHLIRKVAVHCVMVAHAAYPVLELQEEDESGKLLPSSLCPGVVTTLLREKIGFKGLVITDDLEMGAIVKNYGIGDASLRAVAAGNDMVSICAGIQSIMEGHDSVWAAVNDGKLAEDRLDASVNRILSLKSMLREASELDLDRFASLAAEVEKFNQSLS